MSENFSLDMSQYKIEAMSVTSLTPYELNAKKHGPEQVARIAASIQKFGWRGAPIVVDRHGVIIAGHGRRLAAIELGMKVVPVIVAADLSPEQVRALRLADNRAAEGDIDSGMLRQELGDIGELLEGIFDAKELDFVTADMGEMNEGAFVDDMDAVIEEQSRDLRQRHEDAAAARVPLHKVFGFKDVTAATQLQITRLMSRAEAQTGKTGEQALADYLEGALA